MTQFERTVDKTVEKLSQQLHEWGVKIDELAARATQAGTELKADTRERIEALRAKRGVAQARLDELKSAGSEKLDAFKAGVEAAWKDLEAAFKDLTR